MEGGDISIAKRGDRGGRIKGKKKRGCLLDGIVTMSGNVLGEGGVINSKYRRQPFRLGKGGRCQGSKE